LFVDGQWESAPVIASTSEGFFVTGASGERSSGQTNALLGTTGEFH
jgi:hypothetical protein